jgi:Spy/CpxP family protein refolding chaperone
MIDIRSELQKTRVDLNDMKQSETRDRAAFEKLTRTMADLRVRQGLLLFDAHEKVLKQLTPEQQKMFKEMQQERRGKRGEQMKRKFRDRDH